MTSGKNGFSYDPVYGEIESYLAHFGQYAVLRDHADFMRLHRVFRRARSKSRRLDARKRMLYGNVRLVIPVVRELAGRGLSIHDMMQEGLLGVDKAIEKYDPAFGTKFSTYATWWIRAHIRRAIDDMNGDHPFRIPIHAHEKLRCIRFAVSLYYRDHLRWPTADDLMPILQAMENEEVKKMKRHRVEEYLAMTYQRNISLDTHILSRRRNDEEGAVFGEIVPDRMAATDRLVEIKRLPARISRFLSMLAPRDALILRHRFGLGGEREMTLQEIGNALDISRERVRQIQDESLRRIRRMMELTGSQLPDLAKQ